MADVRPFPGLRFDPSRAALAEVLCPPYDVIGPEEARGLRQGPWNVIHLELPEGQGDAKYLRAGRTWREWRTRGLLLQDPPSLYVLEESFGLGGRPLRRMGFLAALGVAPSAAGCVLAHERTLPKPKADRLSLVESVKANISPIFGLFPDPGGRVRKALRRAARRSPVSSERWRGVAYRLWRVSDSRESGLLRRALARAKILIADGHHRYEVSREYYLRTRRSAASGVLAYLCPEEDEGLVVLPTHRVVVGGALEEARRLCRLTPCRSLSQLLSRLERSGNPYACGLWAGRFFLAEPKNRGGCRSGLCVEWLGRFLLKGPPERIGYTPDPREALARARDLGGTAVFVKPLRVPQIRRAVRAIGLLPPKSTYFYPKIPAGLVFNPLDRASTRPEGPARRAEGPGPGGKRSSLL